MPGIGMGGLGNAVAGLKSPSKAPPVPGGSAPPIPTGLAPPVPGNRARSNSDQSDRDSRPATSSIDSTAPQLGGLFAGGIPKLKKARGGIDTGGMSVMPLLMNLSYGYRFDFHGLLV